MPDSADPFVAYDAARGANAKGEGKGPSQRDKLLTVTDDGKFWRCSDGIAYVTVPVDGHLEHHRVRSQRFRDWLIVKAGREFPIEVAGKTRPGTFGKNAVEDALTACEAMAAASQQVRSAALRVGSAGAAHYLDLGDSDWSAAEVTPSGWRIINTAPVPILRTRRTRPLPRPTSGGSLSPLRELLPMGEEDEWRLAILWMLAALRPAGPYPILALSGEQGTGKSFTARVLRRLVDPCGDDIMQPPREDRDLIAAARGNHVLAFDNLSTLSGELADSICRLATGGDIGGRLLYTNDESAAFSAQRPIIVNGIPDLVSRGDLVSRTIFVRLAPMERRRTEAELWASFNEAASGVLGAMLDVLAAALARLPDVKLPNDTASFRMADFTLLAIAAEDALNWPAGAASAALRRNMRGAAALMTDLDPVAIAIRALIDRDGRFEGLVSNLHARLTALTDMDTRRAPGWPRNASRLGEHLRRLAPALRGAGINVVERRGNAGMIVQITARSSGVGDGSSLFKFGQEERGSEPPPRPNGAVNSHPKSPAPPTHFSENGGNPGASTTVASVGSVEACRSGVGASYTQNGQASQPVEPCSVGSVGRKSPEFTPTLPIWRVTL
jgi:hypothetical protein